ncbi:MAG: hypothetical protein R3C19_22415 [Planctomycetaceae bacterium]
MKKICAVVTAFGALLMSTVIIGRAEPQESRSSGKEPIAQAEHDREAQAATRELLDRIVSRARTWNVRQEEEFTKKGFVKRANGNWGPPLPPGMRLLEAQGAFAIAAGAKPGPGHRGNQLTYLDTVRLRPTTVADALTSSKAPTERLRYFHELIEHPDFQLDGWNLHVRELSSVDGVDRVTIYAIPLVSSDMLGLITVMGAFEETYELRDGELKLVKTAPVGNAPVMGMIGGI